MHKCEVFFLSFSAVIQYPLDLQTKLKQKHRLFCNLLFPARGRIQYCHNQFKPERVTIYKARWTCKSVFEGLLELFASISLCSLAVVKVSYFSHGGTPTYSLP